MATITVQPNQSMMDVIVQAMGTLEGGMCFCALNGVGISDTPLVGTVYTIPDGSQSVDADGNPLGVAFDSDTMVDSGVLQYWAQNGIVIGNYNIAPGTVNLESEDGTEGLESEDGLNRLVSEQ